MNWTSGSVSATMSTEKKVPCSTTYPEGRVPICRGRNESWRNRTRLHRGAGTRPGCHPGVRTQPANHDAERGGCGNRACSPHGAPDAPYAGGTWVCPRDARGICAYPASAGAWHGLYRVDQHLEIAHPHLERLVSFKRESSPLPQ